MCARVCVCARALTHFPSSPLTDDGSSRLCLALYSVALISEGVGEVGVGWGGSARPQQLSVLKWRDSSGAGGSRAELVLPVLPDVTAGCRQNQRLVPSSVSNLSRSHVTAFDWPDGVSLLF